MYDALSKSNYPEKKIDARGNFAKYTYEKGSGLLRKVETLEPADPQHTEVHYDYDALKRLKKVYTTPETGKTYRNDYGYNAKGELVSFKHNAGTMDVPTEVKYEFSYDDLGARTEVRVGAGDTVSEYMQWLSRSSYDPADRSHKLTRTDFANGGWFKNTYDEFDRVVSTEHDGFAGTVQYKFDYAANGQVAYQTDMDLKRTQWTEYDQAGRPMQATTWDGIFDAGTDTERGKLLYRASVKYDKYNRLALFGERVPGKDKPVRQKNKDGTYKMENG